ncbi:cytochrome-c peroxidase [Xanthovirga aplysinae]|uniref:cytochrome-c peroxidase n=1 Tax=Xanthovirga aplysinae TaxID=2529853 RepID=UPI0012BB832B|nr:cytochrome c peroxidase [Xanthovirga aplysinae]MTI33472.1 cytochrome-c peroxidase [Xanthovirga aplysinae]
MDEPTQDERISNVLNLPATPFNYANVELPEHFRYAEDNFDNTPSDNLLTNQGATLGRVLFYDKNLSKNKSISCASCHIQENGFSDPKIFSEGFEGGQTRRNSMGLANSRFYQDVKFFWDHRARTLEEQVLMPIQDEVEMGLTLDELVENLQSLEYYPPLFEDAFSLEEITSDKISKALAQFIRSMLSFNTKYDEGIAQTRDIFMDFPNFTAEENLGKNIFNGSFRLDEKGVCIRCHMPNDDDEPLRPGFVPPNQATLFTVGPRNNGIDANSETATDNGVGELVNNPVADGTFKVPSLRNIALTAPYMHDGRFATLEEVVEHYSTGVQPHPSLSFPALANEDGSAVNLHLSEEEKIALVAFLKTFTDIDFVSDEKYSNPFKENE